MSGRVGEPARSGDVRCCLAVGRPSRHPKIANRLHPDTLCAIFRSGPVDTMQIRAFNAVRPPPELAGRVAAPPYDVVGVESARRLAEGNPMSFLRVTRPELELPDGTPPYAEEVYARAGANYRSFLEKGYLAVDPEPCLYVYRITSHGHEQTGVVAVCSVDDYASNVILRHEKTRAATETDRTRHITALGAQAGPVFLLHRYDEHLAGLLAAATVVGPGL